MAADQLVAMIGNSRCLRRDDGRACVLLNSEPSHHAECIAPIIEQYVSTIEEDLRRTRRERDRFEQAMKEALHNGN